MEGTQIIAPCKRKLFDLEPEVRNQIYSALLSYTDEKVCIISRPPTGRPCMRNSGICPLATAIRTCRQMHSEAAAILYGDLFFEFYEVGVMRQWLRGIDAMRHYVRHICLSMDIRLNCGSTFNLLRDCLSLRTLAITPRSHGFAKHLPEPTYTIAQSFAPLFRSLLQKTSTNKQRHHILQIVKPWTNDISRSLVNDNWLQIRMSGYAPELMSAVDKDIEPKGLALAQLMDIEEGFDELETNPDDSCR